MLLHLGLQQRFPYLVARFVPWNRLVGMTVSSRGMFSLGKFPLNFPHNIYRFVNRGNDFHVKFR